MTTYVRPPEGRVIERNRRAPFQYGCRRFSTKSIYLGSTRQLHRLAFSDGNRVQVVDNSSVAPPGFDSASVTGT